MWVMLYCLQGKQIQCFIIIEKDGSITLNDIFLSCKIHLEYDQNRTIKRIKKYIRYFGLSSLWWAMVYLKITIIIEFQKKFNVTYSNRN